MRFFEKIAGFIVKKGVLIKVLLSCIVLVIILYCICMPVSKEVFIEFLKRNIILSLLSYWLVIMVKMPRLTGFTYKELPVTQQISLTILIPFAFTIVFALLSVVAIVKALFQQNFEMVFLLFPTIWWYYFGSKSFYIAKKYRDGENNIKEIDKTKKQSENICVNNSKEKKIIKNTTLEKMVIITTAIYLVIMIILGLEWSGLNFDFYINLLYKLVFTALVPIPIFLIVYAPKITGKGYNDMSNVVRIIYRWLPIIYALPYYSNSMVSLIKSIINKDIIMYMDFLPSLLLVYITSKACRIAKELMNTR